MTLDSTTSKVQYTQSGTTTAWPVPYKFLDNEDLIVITTVDDVDTTLVLDTDYTVAGAGDDDGGTVTISPAVATGTRVTIYREIDLDQPTELTTAGGWFPKVHEAVFDRLTMIDQQLQEQLDRAVKLAPTTTLNPDTVAEELFEARDDAQTAASEAEASAIRAETASSTVAYYNHEGTLLTGEDTISLPWAYDTEVGVEVFLGGVKQTESSLVFTDAYTVTLDTPVTADTAFEVVASAGAKGDLAKPSGSGGVGFLQAGTGATARTVQAKLRDFVSVKDFGAVGDGVTDDTVAIQAAIDYCVANYKTLFLPYGNYLISGPLLIQKKSGSTYQQVTFTMLGEGLPFPPSLGTKITAAHTDTFAIGIQNGRGVKITGVLIVGQNDFNSLASASTNWEYLLTNANYVINSCRDSRYSPYSGICVDPFGTSAPADGGYPGLSSGYHASASGSSGLVFEDMAVQGFVAGVCLSPNGTTANCSEMTFRHCFIQFCKVGLAICQSQSRNVSWHGGSCAFNLYCFDGNTYGLREGYAPYIYGCNMAGKYLFNVANRYGNSSVFSGIHAEQFLSIGFLGGSIAANKDPFVFVGCNFNFTDFGAERVTADRHIYAISPVEFKSCNFAVGANKLGSRHIFPIRFIHENSNILKFSACQFVNQAGDFPLGTSQRTGQFSREYVLFDSCTVQHGEAGGPTAGSANIGADLVVSDLALTNKTIAQFGSRVKVAAGGNESKLYFVGGRETLYRSSLGSVTFTKGTDGTGSFTAADPTIIRVGDLIYTTTATNIEKYDGTTEAHSFLCIGVVTDVTGTTVTVSGVPASLVTGTKALLSLWWPRMHTATTGNTTTGSNVISGVTNAAAWGVGNKIIGNGIPVGAYITGITGTDVTISANATATATGVRLYDADIYSLTGTAV